MGELTFLTSTFIGAFTIGWAAAYKWLMFKKAMESVATNS